jgi:hypothetical protein
MRYLKITAVISLLTWLQVAVAQPTKEQMLGTWYAIDYATNNETTKTLVKRMEDQTYQSISVTCNGTQLSWLEKETGTWELNQNSLIHTPESYQDYNGAKRLGPDPAIIYTDVSMDKEALSYKNDRQTLLSFKPVDEFFSLGCRKMRTIN